MFITVVVVVAVIVVVVVVVNLCHKKLFSMFFLKTLNDVNTVSNRELNGRLLCLFLGPQHTDM